jgi:hypothetical protein
MIKVINKYRKPAIDGIVVNIMRGSILGNPFIMKNSSDSERNRVCELYENWLRNEYRKKAHVFNELHRLAEISKHSNLYLECCCKPKRCHGDFVAYAISKIAEL